ncbi:MAG TPA: tripartite tricarboxylate transporter substrate binding protein [Reyranella sp.]|nr:tripartite tricarboxylate transporter substrate binding protein [Reyranella sp.]
MVAAVSGPLAVPLAARTQDKYPSKPIRLIVPFPPGGGVDLTARLLMEPLAKELGQSIIVENKGGAGGLIGIEAMARSAPDGYTLAVTGVSSMSAGPHLRGDKLPFDPIAFAHITRLVRMPLILAVRNDLPARTLPDFMTLAHSTEIRWASGGIGTSQHLGGELFVQMSGLKMIHVPYRGTGPALNDLAGGVVDAYFGDPATLGIIKSGKARAMAVTSGERWAVLPDTPTLGEAVPGYEAWNWYGLDAPPKTPEPIVDRLAEAVRNVMDDPAVRKKYDDSGLHPATLSRSDYVSFIKRDSEVWGKVIRTGNIKPDD